MNVKSVAKLAASGAVVAALLVPAQAAEAKAIGHCSAVYRVASTAVYLKSCMSLSSKDAYSVYMRNAGSKTAFINAETSYFQFSSNNKSWHPSGPLASSKNRQASHTAGYFTWFHNSGSAGRKSSDKYARVVWRVTVHTGSASGGPAGTKQLYSAFKYR